MRPLSMREAPLDRGVRGVLPPALFLVRIAFTITVIYRTARRLMCLLTYCMTKDRCFAVVLYGQWQCFVV